jgi:hypothetical protein
MTSILDELENLINEIRFEDLITNGKYEGGKLHVLQSKLGDKYYQLNRQYQGSEFQLAELARERAQRLKAQEARVSRLQARADWCKENLKVGDWVKITGTHSASKYRKIMELGNIDFLNIQGDPAMDKTRSYTARTTYGQVTHIMNRTTRIMEKIDVNSNPK